MWLLTLYRFYFAVACGIVCYVATHSFWLSLGTLIVIRLGWFGIESGYTRWMRNRDYSKHIADFKQQLGPYGIRIANKADADSRIKKSLTEVFTADMKKLKKTVEQLEVMDTLFKAGMQPSSDEYLLHDLKLKYGKSRLKKT